MRAAVRRERALRARRDLHEFVRQAWPLVDPDPLTDNWHIGAVCKHLEAWLRGWIYELIISMPPGHAKSKIVAVLFPAWAWLDVPTFRFIYGSYDLDLAERDSKWCRDLIMTPWYQYVMSLGSPAVSGWSLLRDTNRVDLFANTRGGFRMCVSPKSKGSGFRGDGTVIDEPINVHEAPSEAVRRSTNTWIDKTMSSRLNDMRTPRRLMIQQRVHEDDPTGHLLARGTYQQLRLPSEFEEKERCVTYARINGVRREFYRDPRTVEGELLFPVRFPREVLDAQKPILGSDGYAAQHQQRPTPAEGGMFKKSWWRFWRPEGSASVGPAKRPAQCNTFEAKVLPRSFDRVGITADCAFKDAKKNDRVACGLVGIRGAERYLLGLAWGNMAFSVTCDTVRTLVEGHTLRLPAVTLPNGDTKPERQAPPLAAAAVRLLRSALGDQAWPFVSFTIVEDAANGPAVVESMQLEIVGLVPVQPKGGKESRAAATQPSVEAGQWYLPEGAEWVEAFVDEFGAFPLGKHDDCVDMVSQLHLYVAGSPEVARSLALMVD